MDDCDSNLYTKAISCSYMMLCDIGNMDVELPVDDFAKLIGATYTISEKTKTIDFR